MLPRALTTPFGRLGRCALATLLTSIMCQGLALAQGAGGPLWVALDGQPAGTPARVVLNTDLSTEVQTYLDVFISGFYVSTRLGDDGRTYQDIDVPGLPSGSAPGEPRLPIVRAEIGIVTTATAAVLSDATIFDLRSFPGYQIWPSPIPAQVHGGTPSQFVRDSTTYASITRKAPAPGA
jgi:hypothetical protein